MQIAGMGVTTFARRVAKEAMEDDVTGMGAELAYRFFLALFPFAIFLAALGGFLAEATGAANPTQRVMDLFGDNLPADAASVIRKQVEGVVNGQSAGLLSFGIIGTIWAAGGGVGALMKSINRTYDIPETRPFWKKVPIQVGLTLLGGVAIIGSFAIMVAFQSYGSDIADAIGAGSAFSIAMNVLRFPVVVAVMVLATAFLYWLAPNTAQPFKWVTPGAVVFTVGWILATVGFAFYVASFGSYNATYGALGGVVVLLVWFYLTNVLLLLGAEVNAVLDETTSHEALAQRRKLVNDELEKRRRRDPLTPESTPVPAANVESIPSSTGGREAQPARAAAARADSKRPGRAPDHFERHGASGAGPIVALAGLFVAAFALKRFAR